MSVELLSRLQTAAELNGHRPSASPESTDYKIRGEVLLSQNGPFRKIERYIEGWHLELKAIDPLCKFLRPQETKSGLPETCVTIDVIALPADRLLFVQEDNKTDQNGHSNITSISSSTLVVNETR